MPKRDIELPNRSGVVDPTIAPRVEQQQNLALQREYLDRERRRPATTPTRPLASRVMEGYRAVRKLGSKR